MLSPPLALLKYPFPMELSLQNNGTKHSRQFLWFSVFFSMVIHVTDITGVESSYSFGGN